MGRPMTKFKRSGIAGLAALLAGLLLSGTANAQVNAYAPSPFFPFPAFRGAAPAEVAQEPAIQSMPQELDESAPVDPRLRRQVVRYDGREAPGTVIIDTPNTYLYYVL